MSIQNSRLDYSTISQNSYAAFDAMSLRNLIIERLNQQGTFTDQNYIGSNLASIIDIVSYSFHTLMFYLNKTSTESMFTEAQLYENINRIVKLLDYKPIGYQTSTLPFNLFINRDSLTNGFYLIPRYSYVMINGVAFSFNEDITFSLRNELQTDTNLIELTDISNNKLLFQGFFRNTPVYNATGVLNETVTINLTNALIDHFNIHVYVWENDSGQWYRYQEVTSLYNTFSYDRVYEKKLNPEKLYEIQFGDNINGRQLTENDKVLIYFLQSSGNDGIVDVNVLGDAENKSKLTKNVLGGSIFNEVFEDTRQDTTSTLLTNNTFKLLKFDNQSGSTIPKEIESADSIRKNAPANFKSQYRLVTEEDYETFAKINFANFISDIKILNNWEYTGKYLKYFNSLKVNATTFQQIALNQTLYADACNFNNVYVCALPKIAKGSTLKYLLPAQKEYILTQFKSLKMLTTEITFLDPIFKAVSFGFDIGFPVSADFSNQFKLEVTKDTNNNRTDQSIIADVANIFQNYFDPMSQKLGTPLRYANIVQDILAVNGVKSIKTIFPSTESDNPTNFETNKLSFLIKNPVYPDLDSSYVAEDLVLNPFDFAYFENLNEIANQIVVV